MKNIISLGIAAVFLLAAASLGVEAKENTNGVHYKNNPNAECLVSGNTVSCSGIVVGLGNETVTAHLDLGTDTVIGCTNHGGQFVEVKTHSVLATEVDLTSAGNNLEFAISVTVQPPVFEDAVAAGCNNNNWTYSILSFSFDGNFSFYWCFNDEVIEQLTLQSGATPPPIVC